MWTLFERGGPIMWPLLVTSIIAVSIVLERCVFLWKTRSSRSPETLERMFRSAERGAFDEAIAEGRRSGDFVARVLAYGLEHRAFSYSQAALRQANTELRNFSRGVTALDTIVTLAPLLGLLGTVTGMINAFGLLGGSELEAPAAITGGIAEALIATAYGLGIAITALIPLNILNAKLDNAHAELEERASELETMLSKSGDDSVRGELRRA
ncbi:MAG: MotA/TolQ/ExbB proton channel family protein [Deltaproteobacteria bacterium]|nr:MotA/TolQ/ExbB proton channel family protein [Deltaproteobacteria bacterium]